MPSASTNGESGVGFTVSLDLPDRCPLYGCRGEVVSASRHVVDDRCRSEFVVRSPGSEPDVVRRSSDHAHEDGCICHAFVDNGAIPTFDFVDRETVTISTRLDDVSVASAVFSSLVSAAPGVEVRYLDTTQSTHPHEERASVQLGALTAKQREAIDLAVAKGYYDTPRSVDLSTLAAELGVSRQALANRLRRAESTVLGAIFGPERPAQDDADGDTNGDGLDDATGDPD